MALARSAAALRTAAAAASARRAPLCSAAASNSGYTSTLDFEPPSGHEFEQVVDVGLSDVSSAAFVIRGAVAK